MARERGGGSSGIGSRDELLEQGVHNVCIETKTAKGFFCKVRLPVSYIGHKPIEVMGTMVRFLL